MNSVSSTTDVAALLRRVEALSRKNRARDVVVGGVVVVAIIGGAGPESTVPAVLQARSIQLVDDAGRTRAELSIDNDGSAGLFVRDEKGRVRATLTHDEKQSALFIWDEDGQIRVGVAQFAHGGGGVALHGPHGKGSTVLYHKRDGSLTFYDKEGKISGRIPNKGD